MSSILLQPISSYIDTDRKILSFLGPSDLVRCSEVCQMWHALTEEDDLWRDAIPKVLQFTNKDIKQWINCHVVTSEETLLKNFERFTTNVQLNQYSRFECIFPCNPDCSIVVKFRCGDSPLLSRTSFDTNHICLSLDNPTLNGNSTGTQERIGIFLECGGLFSKRMYLLEECSIIAHVNHLTKKTIHSMIWKQLSTLKENYQNQTQISWINSDSITAGIYASKLCVSAAIILGVVYIYNKHCKPE